MKKLLKKIFPPAYEWYKRELIARTVGTSSLLDLGCGFNSYVQYLDKKMHRVGVDLFDDYIKKSTASGIHDRYFKQDIRNLKNFKDRSFDAVCAADVIEHLTKEEGLVLIKEMERIAKKLVVISTPNGHRHQECYDENEFQAHKSGWVADEFKTRGFSVLGMDGLRLLRGDMSVIRFRPRPLWSFISNITQFFVYRYPKLAHSLFCVKKTTYDTPVPIKNRS